METRHLSELVRFAEDKLQKLSVFHSPRMWIDVYCLRPGQAQRPHTHPASDKVYLVLEGSCRFEVQGEVAEHGPGTAVVAPAGVEHGVENRGPSDARLLVAMSPPPDHG